jgi:CheY-like chemotaxis protein
MPVEPIILPTDPVLARQVLVNTLSQAVAQSSPAPMHVGLSSDVHEATLRLSYVVEPSAAAAPPLQSVVAELAQRLGWSITLQDEAGPGRVVSLHMSALCPTIMVIDDNAGFRELMETYLAASGCRMTAVRGARDALRLAQESAPDAVILDVMMPDMDGWEFLQRLRSHPQTTSIPVIVCSVISNPDLAYSLGASAVLTKAVSQQDLLAALRQVGVL